MINSKMDISKIFEFIHQKCKHAIIYVDAIAPDWGLRDLKESAGIQRVVHLFLCFNIPQSFPGSIIIRKNLDFLALAQSYPPNNASDLPFLHFLHGPLVKRLGMSPRIDRRSPQAPPKPDLFIRDSFTAELLHDIFALFIQDTRLQDDLRVPSP